GAAWDNPVYQPKNITITSQTNIPIYVLPNNSAPTIENLSGTNTTVELLGQNSQWSYIQFGNVKGFVQSSLLNSATIPNNTNQQPVVTEQGYKNVCSKVINAVSSEVVQKYPNISKQTAENITKNYISTHCLPGVVPNMSLIPISDINNNNFSINITISNSLPDPVNQNSMPWNIPLNIYNKTATGYFIITAVN
ncbi:MAG: hypothetical protein ACRCTZ_05715, partial [Sarcina sp.]